MRTTRAPKRESRSGTRGSRGRYQATRHLWRRIYGVTCGTIRNTRPNLEPRNRTRNPDWESLSSPEPKVYNGQDKRPGEFKRVWKMGAQKETSPPEGSGWQAGQQIGGEFSFKVHKYQCIYTYQHTSIHTDKHIHIKERTVPLWRQYLDSNRHFLIKTGLSASI